MSLKKDIQNKWHDLVHIFDNTAAAFISALLNDIEKSGGQVLRDAAIEAVKAAEDAGGSGKEKFDAAVASVVATLTTQGIPIVIHAINGAIEAAVAQLKAENANQELN